jgi:multicomponent Na+:H+ antiporter subunit D
LSTLITLPIVIPLTTAALALVAWRSREFQRAISLLGGVAYVIATLALLVETRRHGIGVVQLGGWPAPYGISLVSDLLSAIMLVMAAITVMAVIVYALTSIDVERERFGFHVLLHVVLLGASGSFLTGDIFNLFVWFEVALMSSFALLALGGERPQLEGALKYVAINLISSVIFLAAVGLLYGSVGSLNMADVSIKLAESPHNGFSTVLAVMFLTCFGIKAGLFPFFFWLPASYHTPPITVSALFAGLLTKVGVYALIRLFTLIFNQDVGFTHTIILVISGFTMVVGVLGAVAQMDVRRLLSFHIISQIGYMTMGLAFNSVAGLAGAIFYIAHNILAKTNLFLVAGVAQRYSGSYNLKEMGGLFKASPWLALMFAISAASLAGIPPLSGFFAKFSLVYAGFEARQYAITGVSLAVGLLTALSMSKIWNEAFWKPAPAELSPNPRVGGSLIAPIAAMAALTLLMGLAAGPFYRLCLDAAHQLQNPSAYLQAVLGDRP